MAYGKTIELFLVNGDADSIVTAELSNWNGKAIKIPRIEVADCNREDISQPGVYFLFCREEGDKDSVYIGESEDVKQRLVQHLRDYSCGTEAYYWTTAVIFTGRDLNKASIRYLEYRLVEIAKQANRYSVLTKNTYKNTVMKESQVANMEEFIADVKILINALGFKVLEALVKKHNGDEHYYYIKTKDAQAKGLPTSEGFVVLKGAKLYSKEPAKSMTKNQKAFRDELLNSDKVDDFVTQEDILCSSSSAAATLVCGYSTSGPRTWKDKNGRTLKELENDQ